MQTSPLPAPSCVQKTPKPQINKARFTHSPLYQRRTPWAHAMLQCPNVGGGGLRVKDLDPPLVHYLPHPNIVRKCIPRGVGSHGSALGWPMQPPPTDCGTWPSVEHMLPSPHSLHLLPVEHRIPAVLTGRESSGGSNANDGGDASCCTDKGRCLYAPWADTSGGTPAVPGTRVTPRAPGQPHRQQRAAEGCIGREERGLGAKRLCTKNGPTRSR